MRRPCVPPLRAAVQAHGVAYTRGVEPIAALVWRRTADIASLQQADGSFIGDKWGEVDTR